jgi:hypothetical protein
MPMARRVIACRTLASVAAQRTPPAAKTARVATPAAPSAKLERRLIALIAVAVWSILPPYIGPPLGLELDVPTSTEVVDHVVAGVLAIAGAALALTFARRGETDSLRLLAALGVCTLAALFQFVTHVPLVLDAGGPLQPVDTVILHSTPSPVLLAMSLWLMLRGVPEEQSV